MSFIIAWEGGPTLKSAIWKLAGNRSVVKVQFLFSFPKFVSVKRPDISDIKMLQAANRVRRKWMKGPPKPFSLTLSHCCQSFTKSCFCIKLGVVKVLDLDKAKTYGLWLWLSWQSGRFCFQRSLVTFVKDIYCQLYWKGKNKKKKRPRMADFFLKK